MARLTALSRAVIARTVVIAAAGCAAALVAACGVNPGGTSSPQAGGGSQATSAPVSQAPTSGGSSAPSGPPPCATSDLKASVDVSDAGVAAGSTYYPVQFTNTSSATCNLYGYPGVSFVTGIGGSQIGEPATENPAHPRQFVDLAPGQVAHAVLQVSTAQNFSCDVVTANWLRIYPPNQSAPLYASFTAQTCATAQSTMTVETVQAGATGA